MRARIALFAACALLAAFSGARASAQTSTHQRLSVEGKESLELTIGSSCSVTLSEGISGSGIALDPSLGLDILINRSLGLSLHCPYSAWIGTDRDALPRATGALGDPGAALSYTFRAADWRLGTELSYRHPLGIWNEYEAAAKGIVSGAGFPTIGVSFSAIRYLDPIVAGLRLDAETGLVRRERFGQSTRPLVLGLNLFATEALNEVAALTAGLSNRLAWPVFYNGVADSAGLSYSLSGNAALVFSGTRSSLRVGISKGLSGQDSPASLDLGYSYTFATKER